ncbi:3306_t:CDS:1, partial [Diversispora eburnea]
MINNELPTLQKMKVRYPLIYKDDICIRCNLRTEDQSHIFTCENNLVSMELCRNKLISLIVDTIRNNGTYVLTDTFKDNLNRLEEFKIKDAEPYRNNQEITFLDIIYGLIPYSLTKLIHSITRNKEDTNKLTQDIFDRFKSFIRKEIWIKRCKAVKEWERDNGIKTRGGKKSRA